MATLEPGTGTDQAQPAQPDAAGDPTVRLERVTKHFGELVAVKELDLDIGRGEFFTMLGPSGCGKTTTLRMVAGFEQPTAGRVLIDGTDVAGLPSLQAADEHRLPELRAVPAPERRATTSPSACGARRSTRARSPQRVEAELERVGLAAEINRKPNQLSGGQQQRVALARALVNLPKVLLLDEPLGALDLKLRKGLQLELKGIQRDVGITFVYVTHDQEEALTMSDRIAVMNRTASSSRSTPRRTSTSGPRTTFVAGFIGVSNLMPGTVTSATGGRGTIRLDTGLEVEPRVDGLATGERCHAVVRPEREAHRPPPRCAPEAAGSRRAAPGRPSRRRRRRAELRLPRHLHSDRRRPAWRRLDDGPGAECERGRACASPRRRRTGAAELGARAHARRPRVGVATRGRRGDGARLNKLEHGTNRHQQPKRRGGADAERRGKDRGQGWAHGPCAWAAADGRRRAGAGRSLAIAACGGGGIESSGGGNGKVETVKVSGKPTGDLTISNWPLYIDKQHGPRLREGDRHHGQVHRGRQRQRRVLRQAAAAAGQGRVRRPLDLRRHRLDGEQDARPRLPAEPRQGGDAERREEPRPDACSTRPSTRTATLDAVAERA